MENNSTSFNEQFRIRTKRFAIDLCTFLEGLPSKESIRTFKNQAFRSGTSVAANFRAACRARSDAEYYSKLCIVVEECDETVFWLEMIKETNPNQFENITQLEKEANELLKVFSTTKKKIKSNSNKFK
jgi:four helix bundle protein